MRRFLRSFPITHLAHIKMPEVQKHGFTWEKDLLRNVYGATEEEIKSIGYTEKEDVPARCNHLDGVPVSIKTSCSPNSVCMGNPLRIFDSVSSTSPIDLVVIHYQQDDERKIKKLHEITELNLKNTKELLFGTLTREELENLDAEIKKIPAKRKPTPEEHTALYNLRNTLQAKSGALQLNIKCDKTQSRLQCSFNKFQDFLTSNPDKIVAQSKTAEFRGKCILEEVSSGRRQFKKKAGESGSAPH